MAKLLKRGERQYSLQVPLPTKRKADAIVRLKNGGYVRIESKYVSPEKLTKELLYKNNLEWGHINQDKPHLFYEYTLLYVNQPFSDLIREEGLANYFYRSKLKIVTRSNLIYHLNKVEAE